MKASAVAKRRFKVLVVDNDPSGLLALTAALSEGFDVTALASPELALEALVLRRPDFRLPEHGSTGHSLGTRPHSNPIETSEPRH